MRPQFRVSGSGVPGLVASQRLGGGSCLHLETRMEFFVGSIYNSTIPI